MKIYLATCLFLFSINSYAALNKWVDAEGKVHYSDVAPSNVNAKKLRVTNITGAESEASGVAPQKTLAEQEADWKKSQKAKEEANRKAAQEEASTLAKKKNCDTARTYLANLENRPEIVNYNSKGERVVMDDSTRSQQIEEARKSVSTYCN